MNLARRGLLVLGVLLCLAACARKPTTDPALMVEALYAPYIAEGVHHGSLETAPWTDEMKRLIAQMNEVSARRNEPIIDFEPLIDGQDFEITELSVTPEAAPADGRCVIIARFKNFGEAREVDFDLVETAGVWRIADMHTASWDLKTLLQQGVAGCARRVSMPKVAHAGERHRHARVIGRFDDFLVAHRTAGLNDRRRARFDGLQQAIREREERV